MYFQMRGMEAEKYFYPVASTERKINKLFVSFMHFLPERKIKDLEHSGPFSFKCLKQNTMEGINSLENKGCQSIHRRLPDKS